MSDKFRELAERAKGAVGLGSRGEQPAANS